MSLGYRFTSLIRPQWAPEKGSVLTEVVVASLVLSIAIMGVALMFSSARSMVVVDRMIIGGPWMTPNASCVAAWCARRAYCTIRCIGPVQAHDSREKCEAENGVWEHVSQN